MLDPLCSTSMTLGVCVRRGEIALTSVDPAAMTQLGIFRAGVHSCVDPRPSAAGSLRGSPARPACNGFGPSFWFSARACSNDRRAPAASPLIARICPSCVCALADLGIPLPVYACALRHRPRPLLTACAVEQQRHCPVVWLRLRPSCAYWIAYRGCDSPVRSRTSSTGAAFICGLSFNFPL